MFFIFDCNDEIVGNPNGYATFRGAMAQADSKKSKVYRAIWGAYDKRDAAYELTQCPMPFRAFNIFSVK